MFKIIKKTYNKHKIIACRSGVGIYYCETNSGTGTLIHSGSHSNMMAQSIKFNGVEMEEGIYYEITGDITIEISNYKMEK